MSWPCARVARLGGGMKIFGGHRQNFSSNLLVKTKKRSSSQITLRGYGPFASFWSTILAQRNSRFSYVAWRGVTNLMVRISVLASKFKCEDQKTSSAQNQALCWRSLVFFVLKRDLTHAWGAQAVLGRGTGPEMHSSGTNPGYAPLLA